MADKKKMQDPLIWQRMGWELAALHDLMCNIYCDPDYQAVMDKRSFNGLRTAIERLDDVRNNAEIRMARYAPEWSPKTFFPRDRAVTDAAGRLFRQKIADANSC